MLASGSATRKALLRSAGLRFTAVATGVDEDAVKRESRAAGDDAGAASMRLAVLKARQVTEPGALVIGCDQILVCGGDWFDKPRDADDTRRHLRKLRGRTHALATAVAVLCDGEEVWRHAALPSLTMRPFTDAFLDEYVTCEGDTLLGSVGAYRLEGLGVHLFERVDGEHSTILGLPLLALLAFLRRVRILPD